VDDTEIKNGEYIPTYTLMKRLEENPENRHKSFYFIAGSDILKKLGEWKDSEKLKEEIKFLIFVRIGYKLEVRLLPKKYIIEYTSFVASSSTEIRKRVHDMRKYGRIIVEVSEKDIHIEKIRQEQRREYARLKRIAQQTENGKQADVSYEVNDKKNEVDVYKVKKVCADKEMDGELERECKVIEIEKLATIHCDENCQNRYKLEKEYLGIYGIVPDVIIEYIKEHNLYDE